MGRRLTCLHTHTCYCDGSGTVEDFCAAAVGKGLSAIGFSAHAPLATDPGVTGSADSGSANTGWHLPMERFAAYRAEVKAAKEKWAGKITVYLGLEADYIEGIASPARWNKHGLDYVIGAVHYIPTPKGALLEVDGDADSFRRLVHDHFAGDAAQVVRVYYRCVEKMAREGGFDILGHLDLVKKNNRDFFSLESPAYQETAAHAAAVIRDAQKEHGFAVEVNTGALARGTYPDTYPEAALLRLLPGIPFIITTDAHCPEHLGAGYERAIANLREAGYTESAFFEGRGADGKPEWSYAHLA
ncbi:MAG: histidinol-phosphatase [Spirochaetaceae bacterium]|nr:histidinol-phosphatase [Spirochaetaceae bacterium]